MTGLLDTANVYRQYMYSYPHKTAYRPVDAGLVRRGLSGLAGDAAGLYVHIPFCREKCGYCNLFSVASPKADFIEAYLGAVRRQLEQLAGEISLKDTRWDSITLGGGTPALLTPIQLEGLLENIYLHTGVRPDKVFSVIELSPRETQEELVAYLADTGFTRVSIGVQSFIPDELAALGRREPREEAIRALDLLGRRFPVRNMDLIYGIPGQTAATLAQSLEIAISYAPEELFVYPLYTRTGTPMARSTVDQTHTRHLYDTAREILLWQGYYQVSMRRFTRAAVSHSDCGFEQSLALGCGGRSYLGNLHVCEPYEVRPSRCMAALEQFLSKKDFLAGLNGFLLNRNEEKRRYAVKNLLHAEGLSLSGYREYFGSSLPEDFTFLAELESEKLVLQEGGNIRLTQEGMALSDAIGPMFISEDVKSKMMDTKL